MKLNTARELIEAIRKGEMIVLMDDEARENEGDLVIAASHVNAEAINFMARHARGLICLTLTEERCRQLNLPLMVSDNRAAHATKFTVSIEAARGVTTGISAADRARTVLAAVNAHATPQDIVQPGHVFPLQAERGGVLSRAGHTEAGCDLARLAGLLPAAVIVEIMNEDGSMARRPELEAFARAHGLKIGSIADLIQYRMHHEKTVSPIGTREVETDWGPFTLHGFHDTTHERPHLALTRGSWQSDDLVAVRVQQCSVLRDAINLHPEMQAGGKWQGWNAARALKRIAEEGRGALVVIGNNEPWAWDSQAAQLEAALGLKGPAAPASPAPQYLTIGVGSQILRALNIRRMRLMAAPYRYTSLSGFGLEVVEHLEYED